MRIIKKFIKKLYHLIWFLSLFLIFMPNVFAYDFGHWKGSEITQFNYRLTNNNWVSNSTNTSFIWLSHPDFGGSPFADYYQLSATFKTPSTTINKGNTSFQFALGYIDDGQTGYDVCSSISNFNRYVLDYSSDSNNWQHLIINSYSCSANSGFIILTYNATISSQINFSYLAMGLQSDSKIENKFSTLFSAVNILSDSEGSDTIINQNQIIINQNQQSIDIQNQIRDSINSNTEDIINNQNSNTEKEIESQRVCSIYDKLQTNTSGFSLTNSGGLVNNPAFSTSDYIKINNDDIITVLSVRSSNPYYCLYDTNKTLISCNNSYQLNEKINLPDNVSYFRYSIQVNDNKPTFKICKNGNQAIDDSLNSLNDNLTDDTAPDLDLSDLEVSSDTPISDLITMPLTILNTLIQALDGTCTNYTIPFFYNNSLTFPCFTISDYLGNTVTNYIDLFICFYMCYNIAMLAVSVFEDITSLRDIYDSMYVPRHADTGYQPKHAKGGGN